MELEASLWAHLDQLTKPPRSLGRLEMLAVQLGLIQQSPSPQIQNPTMLIFAGDHGAAEEGLSAYPAEVTYQMVLNFLSGGSAISVLSRQLGWLLRVVDAGVRGEFSPHPNLRRCKVGPGTGNFCHGPAMDSQQLEQCLERGAEVVEECRAQGCNLIGVGEMGIANTSSASLITSLLLNLPLESLVGPGTGLNSARLEHKRQTLLQAYQRHQHCLGKPRAVLQAVGGFEIAMLCGALLKAAECSIAVVVDGFIATAGALAAIALEPKVSDYCLFAHQSREPGHALQLAHLGQRAFLDLDLRLGEGSGAALLLPLIQSALAIYHGMAAFAQAGVSDALPS